MSAATLPPAPPAAPAPAKKTSGLGIAALVLGLVALLLGLIPFVGFGTWVIGVVGVVLGFVGLLQRDRKRGTAVAGLIISAVAIVIGLAVSISAVIGVAGAVSRSIEEASGAPQPATGSSTAASAAPKGAGGSAWYASTYGTFATTTLSGTGDDVVKLPRGAKAGIVVGSSSGSGNFAVIAQDAKNQPTGDLLVNTIGHYRGTTAWGLNSLTTATSFKVTANGHWKLVLKPMGTAKALPTKGSGDGVFRYDAGAVTWAVTHRGSANFVVEEVSATTPIPNLAVNKIGNYSGRVPADAGPAIVVVQADGRWTIK